MLDFYFHLAMFMIFMPTALFIVWFIVGCINIERNHEKEKW
tara:strand:- start:6593 stop:6715 length:123 start_codon:yes stop_codon:yes gene_type:complete